MYPLAYFFTLLFIAKCESARILGIFPIPSYSHQLVFRSITHELAKRGHEVVVVTTDPAFTKETAPPNLTEIDMHDISYNVWKEEVGNFIGADMYSQVQLFFKLFTIIPEMEIKEKEFEKIIRDKNQHFDLILLEAVGKTCIGLSEVFKAPIIAVSSTSGVYEDYKIIGAPMNPILFPFVLQTKLYNHTSWEKISLIFKHYLFEKIASDTEEEASTLSWEDFGYDNMPSKQELKNNIHMLFINQHWLWKDNRPAPPGLVHLGGLHQKPKQEISKELKEYMDNSVEGIVYVSFGTNVKPSIFPPERLEMLFKVFSILPYNILLKWDTDEYPIVPKNTKVAKWFPQSSVLCHPNVKLFIMQGGLQSTEEAIAAGVPMIALPVLGDQWFNAEKYVRNKIGIHLEFLTVSGEELLSAINIITGSKSYYENIRKFKGLLLDQRQQSLERAIYWVEYVIRHKGAAHLRAPLANMSWAEWLQLDVISVLFLFFIVTLLSAFIVFIALGKILYYNIILTFTSKVCQSFDHQANKEK